MPICDIAGIKIDINPRNAVVAAVGILVGLASLTFCGIYRGERTIEEARRQAGQEILTAETRAYIESQRAEAGPFNEPGTMFYVYNVRVGDELVPRIMRINIANKYYGK